jgi:hypothetical protein
MKFFSSRGTDDSKQEKLTDLSSQDQGHVLVAFPGDESPGYFLHVPTGRKRLGTKVSAYDAVALVGIARVSSRFLEDQARERRQGKAQILIVSVLSAGLRYDQPGISQVASAIES